LFAFKNKNILILSPEDWGINQLSKHLYANELSKNNTVYFLHTSPHLTQSKIVEISSLKENLFLIHLKRVAQGIFKFPSSFINLQNRFIVNAIRNAINKPIDVVWSFDQSKFQNLKQFNAKIKIFHPVDYIELTHAFVTKIANSADVVFSVSQSILNTINTNTPKYFINHGLDEAFLKEPAKIERPSFIEKNKINVGYVGNINMKLIDYKNLIRTVKENSQLNFVFIGPDTTSNLGKNVLRPELIELKKISNTKFIGQKSKNELVALMPFFDVFWLCYNAEIFPIEVSNSHKILEYLSIGKAVVANNIKTYENTSVLEMTTHNTLIPIKLKEVALKLDFFNSIALMNERIAFAKENTYTKQIERIEKIINQGLR